MLLRIISALRSFSIFLGLYPASLCPSPLSRLLLLLWSIILTVIGVVQILYFSYFIHVGVTVGWHRAEVGGPIITLALNVYHVFKNMMLFFIRMILFTDLRTRALSDAISKFTCFQNPLSSKLAAKLLLCSNMRWFILIYGVNLVYDTFEAVMQWVIPGVNVLTGGSGRGIPGGVPGDENGMIRATLTVLNYFFSDLRMLDTLILLFIAFLRYFENGLELINSKLESHLKVIKTKNDAQLQSLKKELVSSKVTGKEDKEAKEFHIEGERLIEMHNELWRDLQATQFFIGGFCFIVFFMLAVTITFDFFFSITATMDMGVTPASVGFIIRTLIECGSLICLTNAVHGLEVQEKKIELLTTKIIFYGATTSWTLQDERMLKLVMQLREEASVRPLAVSALGYFQVNRQTLTSMSGVISTYLAVLLQFRVSHPGQAKQN